jgi:outer membrane receptor protein involved in Fe transport
MLKRTALFTAILTATTAQAQIDEVIVTATKQSASTQDIPVAVTALNEESLDQLGVNNFADYLIQMPGITAGGSGPGQNTIYIRGVASTTPNLTTSGVAGLAPNVALYIDEQPLSQPGRNLDLYVADLNRIEVLKGPQGTLFGASSQAGTVRLITNKPDPSGFSGSVKVDTSVTKSGEPSNSVEAVINAPVSDKLTLRGVVYVDNSGGYIDNVSGSLTAASSARFQSGSSFQPNADLSNVTLHAADNSAKVEEDFNESTYSGARLSGLWDIDEDWSLLVSATSQTIDSEGVFYQDPELDDLEIQRYEDDTMEEELLNLSWTLEGRLNELDMIYTGAFTDRQVNQQVDYTDYLFVGEYIPYYICTTDVYGGGAAPSGGFCNAPNLFVAGAIESKIQTHEIRFSTDQSGPVKATFGGFYSDLELHEDNMFTYPGSELLGAQSFGPNYSAQGSSAKDMTVWPEGVIFRNDIIRSDKQFGAFGELTYQLTDTLSTTVGARWYDIEVDLKGSAAGSFSNKGKTADENAGNNLDQIFSGDNDTAQTDGVIGKISLSWQPDENRLFYVTASEGFRPGFLNRPGGKGNATYTVPHSFDTDEVTNLELGWKLDLLDGNLRVNGDIFSVDVKNMQVGIFDTSITNLFFADNAADAKITGLEAEFIWQPATIAGLQLSGGLSLLDTEVTNSFVTDYVQKGDELAFAPDVQANIQSRYEWTLGSGQTAHVMGNVSYSDEAATDIVVPNRTMIDSWTMAGVSAGISQDQWTAELYINNLTDERAQLSGNAIFNRDRIVVARPQTIGLRFSFDM